MFIFTDSVPDQRNDDSIDDTDPDHMTIPSLRAWLAKMEAGYGPVVSTQTHPRRDEDDDIDELCWKDRERESAENDLESYAKLLDESGLLGNMEDMRTKLQWAIRVVREETVWVPGWIYPRPMREGIGSSDEEADDEPPEEDEDATRLVWVLQEPEETDE